MHRPWGEGATWQEKGGPGLIQVTEGMPGVSRIFPETSGGGEGKQPCPTQRTQHDMRVLEDSLSRKSCQLFLKASMSLRSSHLKASLDIYW